MSLEVLLACPSQLMALSDCCCLLVPLASALLSDIFICQVRWYCVLFPIQITAVSVCVGAKWYNAIDWLCSRVPC